ncbi:MAG: hypothetical protein E7406_05610 [Ruminococcaceae bacterium]|nr:hypothetical protein [Oscillospiraceae bacterium]
MKEKKEKKFISSAESAQAEDNIKAEKKAEVSQPPTGDEKSFDAGSTRDKEAEFDALIENEYKEQFSKKVQKIIRKRLREVKDLKEENMKNDTEIGTNKEDLLRRLTMENSFLKKRHEDELKIMKLRGMAQKLREQAAETKEIYPEFDFEKEIKNPEFMRLLNLGVSVKNAYEVANIDAILENNTRTAEKKIVDSIRFKGNRPIENGSEGTTGILLSGNASKLSRKERAELAKRAAKGERISL